MKLPLALLACGVICSSPGSAQVPPQKELTRLWASEALSAAEAEQFARYFVAPGRNVMARLRALKHLADHPSRGGLSLLLERSLKGVAPNADTERAFAASLWSRLGPGAEPEALLHVLKKARAAKEPWLELHALRGLCRLQGPAVLIDAARKGKPLSRAAALEALGLQAKVQVVDDLLVELLAAPLHGKVDFERVLAGACASAWLSASQRAGADLEASRLALERYAAREPGPAGELIRGLLAAADRDPLWARLRPRDVKAELGYHSGPNGWFAQRAPEVERPDEALATEPKGTRVRPTEFLGATSSAARVVFVLDLSDSMLNGLAESQRRALAAVSHTGTLPSNGIRTRLDAARHLLIQALEGLDSRVKFAVVAYGDDARTLVSTTKLVSATKGNVRAVARELRALQAGPAKNGFTRGTLQGQTNLRAAIRLAFRLTTARPLAAGDEHRAGVTNGAQALFVFSDGLPNVWPTLEPGTWPKCLVPGYTTTKTDVRRTKRGTREVTRINPETGEAVTEVVDDADYEVERTREVTVPPQVAPFTPPLGQPYVIRASEDHGRLNAFRHVEIHASLLLGGEGGRFGPRRLGYWHNLVRVGSGQLRYLP